jgi:PD-(D/E)XK nuclease superfamily
MGFNNRWMPFASFSLMSEFTPAVGQEYWHCDMKRGFQRVRKKEPAISAILNQDTTVQRIGLLAQQGVYEFHHKNNWLLNDVDGMDKVARILKLEQEPLVVQERVLKTLDNYYNQPVLRGKKILKLSRGDEGIPTPLEVQADHLSFKLFAAIDCLFLEEDGTLHILDFKTGRSDFDLRQGYVYLLIASYLYPNQRAVASFYNLESCKWSELITASPLQLNAIQSNLGRIAQKHDTQTQQYRKNPAEFERVFPPNPDQGRCRRCQFHSVCNFSAWEVSA